MAIRGEQSMIKLNQGSSTRYFRNWEQCCCCVEVVKQVYHYRLFLRDLGCVVVYYCVRG